VNRELANFSRKNSMTTTTKQRPWQLADGSPGQIHELLLECQRAVASVVKDGSGTSAQDIIDTARTVLNDAGVVLRIAAHNPKATTQGKGMFVEMTVAVDFCAPDGSYWPTVVNTGAMAPQLKSYSAAVTVGLKSILRHTLLMHVVASEADVKQTMHPTLREWHNVLLTFKTLEELDAGSDHPARMAIPDDMLHVARNMYRERRADLRASLADDKLAYYEAKAAEGNARKEPDKPTKRSKGAK
jgi:hypothetical protein